jgi:glycerophosphoryl diester phosphodiesterase
MLYDINGNILAVGGSSAHTTIIQSGANVTPPIMRCIAHRGDMVDAPENTIPAFVLAKKKGFDYAECDVSFTADGVAVLLHNATIDATSNGTGYIADMTYEEVSQYDFGSWKSADYTGTKIPTFEEFIRVCKELQLHPYIELKQGASYTTEHIKSIVKMVENAGMKGNVSYVSFSAEYLGYVRDADESARLVYVNDVTVANLNQTLILKTGKNDVAISCNYRYITNEKVELCIQAGIPLEAWSPNDASWIENMNPYITGVTSDTLIAEKVLREKHITEDQ